MASKQRVRRAAGRQRTRQIWGCAIVGLSGAVAMGLVAMIVTALSGRGFFAPMKLIAGTFMGSSALTAGGGAVVLGMITHLVVGLGFGVLFAALGVEDRGPGMRFVTGLLYGTGIFIVMTIFIVPLIDLPMAAHINVIWFLVYHLVYGFTLSFMLPAVRARRTTPTGRIGRPLHA